MITNRREAVRLDGPGLMLNIFDGRSAVLGVVNDVSRSGMRVSTIPPSFAQSVDTCYAVVNGAWKDFHLVLQLRWARAMVLGKYKMCGFQIQDPPADWTRFIEKMESEQGADKFFAA
ncbi:MAG: hypothetical protein ACYC9M_15155 [Desulfobulbaceae bacterium]